MDFIFLPLCCRAREIPPGEQDPGGLGHRAVPGHRASTERDSEPTVQHDSLLGAGVPAASCSGSCKLRWHQGLCPGPRETTVFSQAQENKGKHPQNTGTAQGDVSQGPEQPLLTQQHVVIPTVFRCRGLQTFLCSQSLGDSSSLPTVHAALKPARAGTAPSCLHETSKPLSISCRRDTSKGCRRPAPARTCSSTGGKEAVGSKSRNFTQNMILPGSKHAFHE